MGMWCELYRNSKINGVVKQWNMYIYIYGISGSAFSTRASVSEWTAILTDGQNRHTRALLFEWNSVARWTVDTSRFGCSRFVSYRNFFSIFFNRFAPEWIELQNETLKWKKICWTTRDWFSVFEINKRREGESEKKENKERQASPSDSKFNSLREVISLLKSWNEKKELFVFKLHYRRLKWLWQW